MGEYRCILTQYKFLSGQHTVYCRKDLWFSSKSSWSQPTNCKYSPWTLLSSRNQTGEILPTSSFNECLSNIKPVIDLYCRSMKKWNLQLMSLNCVLLEACTWPGCSVEALLSQAATKKKQFHSFKYDYIAVDTQTTSGKWCPSSYMDDSPFSILYLIKHQENICTDQYPS